MALNSGSSGGQALGAFAATCHATHSKIEEIFHAPGDDPENVRTVHKITVEKVGKSYLTETFESGFATLTEDMCREASYALEIEMPRVGDLVSTMFIKIHMPGCMNVIENHEGSAITFMGGYMDQELITLQPGEVCEVLPNYEWAWQLTNRAERRTANSAATQAKPNIVVDASQTGSMTLRPNNNLDAFGMCCPFYCPVYAMFETIEVSFGRGVVESYDADILYLLFEFGTELFTEAQEGTFYSLKFDTTSADDIDAAYAATRTGAVRYMAMPSVLNFQHEKTTDGTYMRIGWWHQSTSFHTMTVTLTLKPLENYIMNFAAPESGVGRAQQFMPVRLAQTYETAAGDVAEAPSEGQEKVISLPLRTVAVPHEYATLKSKEFQSRSLTKGELYVIQPSNAAAKDYRSLRWYFFAFSMAVEMAFMGELEAGLYQDANTELPWITMTNIRFRACPQSAAPANLSCCEEPDIEQESDVYAFDFLIQNYRTYKSLIVMIRTDSQLIASPRRGEKPSDRQEFLYGPVWYKNRTRIAYRSGVQSSPIVSQNMPMMRAMAMYANEATQHSVPTSANGMHGPSFWKMQSTLLGLNAGSNEVFNLFGRWNDGSNLVTSFGAMPLNVARIDKMGVRMEVSKFMFANNEHNPTTWMDNNFEKNKITVCFIATANNVLRIIYGLCGLAIAAQ